MIITLEENKYYHIYNRGINSCNLFDNNHDYSYFLMLAKRYLSPVSNIYAYALMLNHFHFVIKFNSNLEKPTHQYLSNLFNAYTKAYNLWNNRHGALFERPFRRKMLTETDDVLRAILYVNNNPIKHEIVRRLDDYKWNSFPINSNNDEFIAMDELFEIFSGEKVFIDYHNQENGS